ncbi:MAG TPA: aminomethyl-transferring glycine dehydrogenase subunit GcvPA [Candidatus Anaerotruncus excrementipullorum]|uniref:Probable glycine dehydrogenase (decarboxylating) subunit 1 n=1 Tax=Candidatus Anaerotruncus excrementipullorum TaxID=2838465 RepID=A0A9D1WUJ1_9FIRM|nr:aminomethyl-transferring glycine dehydrogenase subunit GcvPA [Candidatus Anaerotruncus excrementipullorum]
MGSYLSNTDAQQRQMLQEAGYRDWDHLFEEVPAQVRLDRPLDLPAGGSELEVRRQVEAMAAKNRVFPHIFRGAGAYNHYIPSIVRQVTSKEEFVTAYTPYQAEISQGNLQAIFEYQTMICELTGMDAANASVYDGACAAAEAVFMCRDRRRGRVLVSGAVNPQTLETIRTYCHGRDTAVEVVPAKEGATDLETLAGMLDNQVACLVYQQPNYFGVIEDAAALTAAVHGAGGKAIASCNPISLGLMETPAQAGADIAVGEGQPLGMPLSFGGPYLGFMACTQEMMRKLPGRIVGQTTDSQGKRGFVLTLQAREQHIRREKASSNICSNEALCALTASVYLSAMGPRGLAQAATLCCSKAHYLQQALAAAGLEPVYAGEFFHEFVTRCPVEPEKLLAHLEAAGYLGGLPLADGSLLWCATELNTKEEMDALAALVKEVLC